MEDTKTTAGGQEGADQEPEAEFAPPRPATGPKSLWTQEELAELEKVVLEVGPYRGCKAFSQSHRDRSEQGAAYQYRTHLKQRVDAAGGPRTISIRLRNPCRRD